MKILNNFDNLAKLIDFPSVDVFYFIQIMRRAKDHPEMPKMFNKVIRNYIIGSHEEYESIKPHIVRHCTESGSRAYIRLNKRSKNKNALRLMQKIADLMMYNQYDSIPDAFYSVAGEYHNDPEKKWLVDFDYSSGADLNALKETIKDYFILENPSFNGTHLITKPFDLRIHKDWLEKNKVEIHKDHPTILFAAIP